MLFTPRILLQAAVVLVEVALLALEIAGIKVHVCKAIRKGIAKTIVETIKSCQQTLTAIENFLSSWKEAEDVANHAWAIWGLLTGMGVDILWIIVKACIKRMSMSDWAKTIAVFALTWVASMATDGGALVCKITLALNSAVGLHHEVDILLKLARG